MWSGARLPIRLEELLVEPVSVWPQLACGGGVGGGGVGGGGTGGGGAGGGACGGAGSSRQPAEAAEEESAGSEVESGMESEGSEAEGEAEGGEEGGQYDKCYQCGVRGHWSADCRAPRVYLHCPFGQKEEAKARE